MTFPIKHEITDIDGETLIVEVDDTWSTAATTYRNLRNHLHRFGGPATEHNFAPGEYYLFGQYKTPIQHSLESARYLYGIRSREPITKEFIASHFFMPDGEAHTDYIVDHLRLIGTPDAEIQRLLTNARAYWQLV